MARALKHRPTNGSYFDSITSMLHPAGIRKDRSRFSCPRLSFSARPFACRKVERSQRCSVLFAAACMVVISFSRIAVAQSADPADSTDVDSEVERLIDAGAENYNIKNYKEASALFRQAYAKKPLWSLWYKIAQSESSARCFGLALEAYEKYMAMGGDQIPEDRVDEVVSEVRLLRELVGRIEVEGAPEGAEVYVDDTLRATIPLVAELRVTASVPHQVDVVMYGRIIHSQPLTVGSASTAVIRLGEKKAPVVKPPAPGSVAVNSRLRSPAETMPGASAKGLKPLKITFITSAVLTVLTAGATATFWGIAGSKNDELDNLNRSARLNGEDVPLEKMYNLKDDVEQFDLMTTAALISTAALATVTTISGIQLLKKTREERSAVTVLPGAVVMRF